MGTVPQGGRKEDTFWLTNNTDKPVEIAAIEDSCGCVTLRLDRPVVFPGEKMPVRILVDLGEKSRFSGTLALEIVGKTPGGEVAFGVVCRLRVTIRDPDYPHARRTTCVVWTRSKPWLSPV